MYVIQLEALAHGTVYLKMWMNLKQKIQKCIKNLAIDLRNIADVM